MEPLFAFLFKRTWYNQYAYLEWTTNWILQLQRLAHEGMGYGSWSRGTSSVPVTEGNDLVACLDISRLEHPVLQRKYLADPDHSTNSTNNSVWSVSSNRSRFQSSPIGSDRPEDIHSPDPEGQSGDPVTAV